MSPAGTPTSMIFAMMTGINSSSAVSAVTKNTPSMASRRYAPR